MREKLTIVRNLNHEYKKYYQKYHSGILSFEKYLLLVLWISLGCSCKIIDAEKLLCINPLTSNVLYHIETVN